MKTYTVKVNGTVYDVEIEEKKSSNQNIQSIQSTQSQNIIVQESVPVNNGEQGSVELKAGAAGKVFKIEKNVGDSVSKGEAVIILEAMKMEIPVVASEDGIIASINCSVGDACEAGQLLATLK